MGHLSSRLTSGGPDEPAGSDRRAASPGSPGWGGPSPFPAGVSGAAYRGRAPIEKVYFDVDVRFPRGEQVVTQRERIDQIVIPRANEEISGENFEILVGFELTPEQLQFNRDGRRFRIDAGENQAPGQ